MYYEEDLDMYGLPYIDGDPLTGLGNRKSFENYFNAVTHSITSERPMTATMVTLPSLVNINRTLSYQKGDEYVTDVAKMLKLSLAELNNYRLCRINGSTFVFIAPYDITFLYNLLTCLAKNSTAHIIMVMHA